MSRADEPVGGLPTPSREQKHVAMWNAINRLEQEVVELSGLIDMVKGQPQTSGVETAKQALQPSLAGFLERGPTRLTQCALTLAKTRESLKELLF